MKKIYLALVAMLISFNAHAFIISPHVGLDYVSCSPFRVPIARLAAAQAAIKEQGNK